MRRLGAEAEFGHRAPRNLRRAEGPPGEPEPMGFRDIVEAILHHQNLVAWTILVCIAVPVAYLMLASVRYTASIELLVDPRGLQVVDRDVTPRAQTVDSATAAALVENQARILLSDKVLKRVVVEEKLDQDPDFSRGGGLLRALLPDFLRTSEPKASSTQTAIFRLRQAIRVKRASDSHVLTVWITTSDPVKSANLADAIAETYVEAERGARSDLTRQASEALTRRLSELNGRVVGIEKEIEALKTRDDLREVRPGGGLIVERQIADLSAQLGAARTRTSQARARLSGVEGSRAELESTSDALGSRTVSELRVRLAAARQQLDALGAELLPSHPRVRPARERVATLERQIEAETRRLKASAKSDLERALADERNLEAELAALKKVSQKASVAQIKLRELEREEQASRQVFEAFLKRAKELGEQQGVDNSLTRILAPAAMPLFRDGPGAALLIAASLVSGLGLGLLLALLAHQFCRRRAPEVSREAEAPGRLAA